MIDQFHHTSIDPYCQCPRKFKYSEIYHWKPEEAPIPLGFGVAWHEGMTMREVGLEQAKLAFTKSYHENVTNLPEGNIRTLQKGLDLLDTYWERYPVDPWTTKQNELGAALDFEGFIYYSRIDKVIEYSTWIDILDYKTTRDFGPQFFKHFVPDRQPIGYITTVRQYYENVGGCWIDAVQIAKTKASMGRERFTYRPSHFEWWKKETVQIVRQIWDDEKAGIWPKHDGTNCFRWGECEYHGLCGSGIDYADPLDIPSGFKYEPFKPWEDWEVER